LANRVINGMTVVPINYFNYPDMHIVLQLWVE